MIVLKSISSLQNALAKARAKDLKIGFVPTMGALHKGHISLLERCRDQNSICICSIFVNPTQFDDQKDLDNYPITIDEDKKLLEKVNCSYLFLPSTEEIYPNGTLLGNLNLDGLDKIIEGESRPGHFQGVAHVLHRFFELIQPHKAYFGQKDFQQTVVVKTLVNNYHLKPEIIVCPIVREKSGLAFSSRNERLPKKARDNGGFIFETLQEIKYRALNGESLRNLISEKIDFLNTKEQTKVDYLISVNTTNLQEVDDLKKGETVLLTVVEHYGVRLLDNLIIN